MEDPLELGKFKIQISKLASQSRFRTRAGFELSYRLYPSWSENLIVLFHGIGADSRYLAPLALKIAESGIATVVTPDLRGHGVSFGASDKISPNQLEEDWEELLIHLRSQRVAERIWLAGHSLGGALALKILSSPGGGSYEGGLLIAPYLPPSFQIHRQDYGGWITFQDRTVHVQKPEIFRLGDDKLSYSEAYMAAVSPASDFMNKLAPHLKIALLVGDRDQVFLFQRYQEIFSVSSQFVIRVFPDENHFSILAQPSSIERIVDVFKELWSLS